MADGMLSDSRLRWTAPALGTVMGLVFRSDHDQFRSDVMVEAEAEMNLDARPVLPRIQVPVLLVGGDKDDYLPISMIEETARLIPDCTLKIYEGKSHMGTIRNRQFGPDILDFIHAKETATT
jgi:pimeloyl-ACP methyl ester carboxylesterase